MYHYIHINTLVCMEQGIDQIPIVHLGVAASAMEKRGIRTGRGDLNRGIEVTNVKFIKPKIFCLIFYTIEYQQKL